MDNVVIRNILLGDNQSLASIVRSVLSEFGANHPGTVYYDPTTDRLFEFFQKDKSIYYVAQNGELIRGGAGIYPSPGLPEKTCELVKMYLIKQARGLGLGKQLIEKCISFASNQGFRQIYIETMPELKKAMDIYEKFGFNYLDGPMGNTGHSGCKIWMLKDIG